MIVARFWAAVVLFHAAVLGLSVLLARRWRAQLDRPDAGHGSTLLLARDALLFGAGTAGAGAIALVSPSSGFTYMRLLCQALFGEGVLLAAWIAWLHARRRHVRPALAAGGAALALLAVYRDAYHREPTSLQVRHHSLEVWPAGGEERTLRILHLTDLQTPRIGAHEERAFREALAQSPDLMVFTGDYIHERIGVRSGGQAAADLRALLRRLDLRAPLGVFATEGDSGLDCESTFAGLNVRCLADRSALLPLPRGGALALVGLSAALSRNGPPDALQQIVAAAPPADLRVVIGHRPDFVASLAHRVRVDLALAGHTHGGQVVVPFFGPPLTLSRLPRRYAADLHDYAGIPLHVSRGVGLERGTAPQIRFLCPPEICVVDVRYSAGSTRTADRTIWSPPVPPAR
jgi:predicted MPP superfamily phosphohydrolase